MEGVEIIQLNGFLDAYEKMDFFKRKVEEIRKKRNEMLLKTDYLLLPDSNISGTLQPLNSGGRV